MDKTNQTVDCETHGPTSATYLCQHLVGGEKRGFNPGYDPDLPDDLWPDAWCDECEKVLESEGEWNDESQKFADIRVLCCRCYEDIRDRNWVQDDEVLHELIRSSFSYMEPRQKKFIEKYQIDKHERWDWYQETGKLVFTHDDIPQVEADIHFSGSFSTKSDTWMWAWANISLDEGIKSESQGIRNLGEELGLKQLATGRWTGTEVDGWEMTTVMAKHIKALGTYRTPNDNGFVYMVVTKARWLTKSSIVRLLGR